MPTVLVEQRGAVTLLTPNRPEVHNGVDAETAVLLAQAIERFAAEARHPPLAAGARGPGPGTIAPRSRR